MKETPCQEYRAAASAVSEMSQYYYASARRKGESKGDVVATLMVGYDLNRPGQDYPDLWEKLKSYDNWWHYLDSTWLIVAERTAAQLRDELKVLVDANDELLVIDVTDRDWATRGFVSKATDWLKTYL